MFDTIKVISVISKQVYKLMGLGLQFLKNHLIKLLLNPLVIGLKVKLMPKL